MACGRRKHISLTHFINPQLFWYHEIAVPNEAYREIKELEEQLDEYYKTHQPWSQAVRHPAVHTMVAVKFLAWHKMIRARVDHIASFSKNAHGGEFIMWAIDYGFPFQTRADQIFRLPDKLSKVINHVQRGGLANVLPAEKDFDFRMSCAVTKVKENWCQRACDLMEKLLNEAESVVFDEKFHTNEHTWGSLIVTTHLGDKCNMRDYLVGMSLALDAGTNFRETCLNLKVTQILPWMTNSGNSKFSSNKGFLYTGNSRDEKKLQSLFNIERDNYAKRKVEDWCARNDLTTYRETTVFEGDIFLDDIGFDDSVSNKNYNMHREEVDEQQMGLAGAVTKTRKNKEIPPKPSSIAFDMSAESGKNIFQGKTTASGEESLISDKNNIKDEKQFETQLVISDVIDISKVERYATKDTLSSSTHSDNAAFEDRNKTERKEVLLSGVESLASTHTGTSSRKQQLIEKRKQLGSQGIGDAKIINNSKAPLDSEINVDGHIINVSNDTELDIEKQMRKIDISPSVINSRVKRHLHNRHKSPIRQEDNNIEMIGLSDHRIPQTPTSSKRIELMRKRRLEKLKAGTTDKNGDPRNKDENPDESSVKADEKRVSSISKPSSHIGHLINMRKKVKDTKKDSYFELSSSRRHTCTPTEVLNDRSTFHGLRMIPAGFDLSNLNDYKDEKNHWHRKLTTRFDRVPHDDDVLKSSSTGDALSVSNHLSSSLSPTAKGQKPNFLHTKSHNDKKKLESPDTPTASVYPSVLDTTVPQLNEDSTDACNIKREVISTFLPQVQRMIPTHSSSLSKKFRRFRSLKSPATQMNKIDEILRCAHDEKKGGNVDILDLDTINLSHSKDDSDNTELYSAEGGICGGTTSDNEDNDLEQNKSNNSSLIKIRLRNKISTQQAHLKHIEDQITSKLNGKDPDSFKISMPIVQELREVEGEYKLKTKFIDHLVLAHSKVPLISLTNISDAYFLKEIHDEMENMRVRKLYRIQAYAWPHLLRGNSLFVVNPPKSGKTWSYLPAICSLVAYRIQSGRLTDSYGPVAIILVPTSAHVEMVQNYCKRLLLGIRPAVSTIASFGVRNATEAKIQLLNSCGILVSTPASLLRLLRDNDKESLIDIQRLKHMVIDDMDLMLSRSQDDLESVLKTFFIMSKHCTDNEFKSSTLAWQLVVTSRDWDSLLVALMRKSNQPLLLMGDFLEAAVYGKVMISIKLCPSARKIATILDFIEQNSLENERLLILCNSDDDVYEVVDALTASAYICIAYDSSSTADVRVIVDEWKQIKVVSSRILVCADSAFPELQVQNVAYVIHYSMPTSWTKFTARFSALAQTYDNYVSKNFDIPTGVDRPAARSLILLDQENSIQLPRLMDFMKKHGQLKFIHSDILAVSKCVLEKREEMRVFQGTRMCPYVLEYGECDEARCEFRHNLTRFDVVSKNDSVPTAGDMRILILKVFSPTHYAARLLQHRPPNSTKWLEIRRSREVCNFSIDMHLHYMNRDNCTIHWPLHKGDLCIYKFSDAYQRVRILDLPDIQNTDIIKVVKLTVKLIDQGSIISSVKSDELLVCHNKFKNFPHQAFNIRLAGVVPFDNERTWDTKATKSVQKWIMTDITQNECVHVSINFAIIDTIWVNNVIVMEQLDQVGQYVYRVNLKRSLVEKEIGVTVLCKRRGIYEIAKQIGLFSLNDEQIFVTDSEMDFKSCSENNTSNLIKFSSNDDTLESEKCLQTETRRKSVSIGNNEVVLTKLDQLIEINDDKDLEDDWDEQLKSSDSSAKEIYLPLRSSNVPCVASRQNSECDVSTGALWKEEWIALPLERLVKVEIGNEDENGNWGDIYLQHIDDEQLHKFDELLDLINSHVKQLSAKPTIPFPTSWFQPMQNCIVNYDDRYLRAKLYGVFRSDASVDSPATSIYRFFLCDYACFIMANGEDLYNDFLYPTTKEIVEFTPYQAVHCTLAGIKFNRFAKHVKVTKPFLFAYAVFARESAPLVVEKFNIRSFDILLYENDTDDNLEMMEMLNRVLINNNVATLDDEAKHFLDMNIKLLQQKSPNKVTLSNGNGNSELCNFENLLKCIERAYKLEMDMKEIESPLPQVPQQNKNMPDNSPINKRSHKELLSKYHRISSGSDEEALISSTTNTSNTSNNSQSFNSAYTWHDRTTSSMSNLPPLPQLKTKHKRPQIIWYDTDCFIYVCIHTPDVNDYYLEVSENTLLFCAQIQDQPHAAVLNFLGNVDPAQVSHEIRGLNVVIHLVKAVFIKWPRLLKQSTKFGWLTYNFNAIDLRGVEKLLPQQQFDMILQKSAILNQNGNYSSDESDNDERNIFQTFTPIINSEDIHDPSVEMF